MEYGKYGWFAHGARAVWLIASEAITLYCIRSPLNW